MAHDRTPARTAAPHFVGRGPLGTLTEEDARQLLEEQTRSGLSFKEFANSKGLSPQRLSWWKSKFARVSGAAGTARAPTFVSLSVQAPNATTLASTTPASARAYELRLDTARSLRIPPDFEDATLARLLRVLSEAP